MRHESLETGWMRQSMTDWLTDWLTAWLTDWLTDWLTNNTEHTYARTHSWSLFSNYLVRSFIISSQHPLITIAYFGDLTEITCKQCLFVCFCCSWVTSLVLCLREPRVCDCPAAAGLSRRRHQALEGRARGRLCPRPATSLALVLCTRIHLRIWQTGSIRGLMRCCMGLMFSLSSVSVSIILLGPACQISAMKSGRNTMGM